jgi:hypothetical protein
MSAKGPLEVGLFCLACYATTTAADDVVSTGRARCPMGCAWPLRIVVRPVTFAHGNTGKEG